jgi:hypothetical protein
VAAVYSQDGTYEGDDSPPSASAAGANVTPNASQPLYTLFATADPNIVKMRILPQDPQPAWATAFNNQPDGSHWIFGPTAQALISGNISAMTDSVAAIPGQVQQNVQDAANAVASGAITAAEGAASIGKWIVGGLIALAVLEIGSKFPRGRR